MIGQTFLTVSDSYQGIICVILLIAKLFWHYLPLAREGFPDEGKRGQDGYSDKVLGHDMHDNFKNLSPFHTQLRTQQERSPSQLT